MQYFNKITIFNRQLDKQTVGQKYGQTDGQLDGQTDGRMDEPYRQTDRQIDRQNIKYVCLFLQICRSQVHVRLIL